MMLLLGISLEANAQNKESINFLPYNSSDIGWYASASYGAALGGEWGCRFGLTFHYNQVKLPDRHFEYYLHKRFYADNSFQKIGVSAELNRRVKLFDFVTTTLFYEMSYRNLGAKSYRYVDKNFFYNQDSTYLYLVSQMEQTHLRNLHSFEHIFGIRIAARAYHNIYFISQFGFGTNIIFNTPASIFGSSVVAEYSLKYGIGFQYRLK